MVEIMTVYWGGKYLKTSREVLMPRRPMDPTPVNSFALVYDRINSVPGSRIDGLVTTGGVGFSAEVARAQALAEVVKQLSEASR